MRRQKLAELEEMVREKRRREEVPPVSAPAAEKPEALTPQERSSMLADIGMGIQTGRSSPETEQAVMQLVGLDSLQGLAGRLKSANDDVLQEAHRLVEQDRIAQAERATAEEAQPKTKLQQAAEKATQEAKDETAAFGKMLKGKGLGMNPFLDPEIVAGAARLTVKWAKAGTLKFAAFLEGVASTIGQAATDRIRPVLEAEWEKLRQIGEVPDMEAIAPPAAEAPSPITGTKNVLTDELRARAGLGERIYGEPESIEQWQEEARQRIAADPSYAPRLAEDVAQTERHTDKIEDAALNRYIRELENRRRAGEDVRDELLTAAEAAEVSGRQWGQWGRGRQVELEEDFSVAGIVRQHLRAVKERPTDEQMAKYEELASRIEVLEAERDALQVKLAQAEVDKQIAVAKKAKQPAARPKKGAKRERLQRQASDAVSRFKEEWATLFQMGVVYDPKREAEKWARIVKAAGKVVQAYAKLGVDSFLEFIARIKKDFPATLDQSDAFEEAWRRAHPPGESPLGEAPTEAGIGKLARNLTRWAVEAGTEGREEVIDAVHQELGHLGIELSRSETMQAMSGYGEYRELAKDEVSVKVRGIKGEIQQLLKLEAMQAGRAPKKTGIERRTPTDEERRLIKKVEEAKKRGGYAVTDPARQLKSALGTAKTTMRNRIADLKHAIAAREKIVKERTLLKADAELQALRNERDTLQDEYNRIFPPKRTSLSDAQRLKMAEASIDRQLAELEADLEAGRLGPKEKRPPVTSPALEQKKQRRAELYEARERAREASPEYQAQEAARQNARYKKSLQRQLAFWEKRLAEAQRGRLPAKRIKKTPLDQEILEKQTDIAEVKREAIQEINRIKREQRPTIQKAAEVIPEALNALRAILTSFDLSAVLRQGGVLSAAHPMLSKEAFVPMLKAFASERGQQVAAEALKDLSSAELAQKAGLEITTDEQSLAAMEEAYMSRLAGHIPGVSHSARAYMTFLNVQRAMVFDALVAKLARKGEVTLDEAKILANWVNVASGRGNMGRAQGAATALATAFFAPRYVLSRFQFLLGQPLWTGLLKGQGGWRARALVAKEYGRLGTALGIFYGTFALAAALLYDPDDEDKPTLTFDPRSADFGKLKFGETRIDPLAGLAQVTTLLGRLWHGETVGPTGEVRAISGEEREFTAPTIPEVMGRFIRTKLSPALGTAVDIRTGENVVGEETTLMTELVPFQDWVRPLGAATPLIWEDVYEAIQAQGVPKGSAMGILAILGASSQTYGDRFTYERGAAEERKEQFEKDLENMEWDTPPLAYSDLLSPKQREQVEEQSDETFAESLKERYNALQSFRQMGLSHDEAQILLVEWFWRPNKKGKSGTEMDGIRPKTAYSERGKALARHYGKDYQTWRKDFVKARAKKRAKAPSR
jgi:hypothetical protein